MIFLKVPLEDLNGPDAHGIDVLESLQAIGILKIEEKDDGWVKVIVPPPKNLILEKDILKWEEEITDLDLGFEIE
jgi:hypothetical protein